MILYNLILNALMEFTVKIIPYYDGDTSWVQGRILDAIECLKSNKLPAPGRDCDYCKYRKAVKQAVSQFET